MIAVWGELADKMFVREYGSLLEAVHAAFDFDINISAVGEDIGKLVLGAYCLGKILIFETHVFGVLHR